MQKGITKTVLIALLALAQVFAVVAPGRAQSTQGAAAAEGPVCLMVCCAPGGCDCSASPIEAPAPSAPYTPVVERMEVRLMPWQPLMDIMTLLAPDEPVFGRSPVPSVDVVIPVPAAPLFTVHCSWLI